jgi:hypothetical protein
LSVPLFVSNLVSHRIFPDNTLPPDLHRKGIPREATAVEKM